MPNRTEYVAPEVFLEHQGVTVFRSYKDDDIDFPLTYWFSTDEDEDPSFEFDIRDLSQDLVSRQLLPRLVTQENESAFQEVLRTAIENKLLKHPDIY